MSLRNEKDGKNEEPRVILDSTRGEHDEEVFRLELCERKECARKEKKQCIATTFFSDKMAIEWASEDKSTEVRARPQVVRNIDWEFSGLRMVSLSNMQSAQTPQSFNSLTC